MGRKFKEHAIRRQELIDAALQLFCDKGYEKTSVNDILNTVGVAKGTFYHYFKSKEQLLDSLVELLTGMVMSEIDKIAKDKAMNAIDKINRIMTVSREIKTAHAGIIKAILNINFKHENIVIRHKMRERNRALLVPMYDAIIRQGVQEGSMDIPYPEEAAILITGLTLETGDRNTQLLISLQQHPENKEIIIKTMKLLEVAVERILGLSAGSVVLADEKFITTIINQFK